MSVAASATYIGVALNVQATGGSGSFHNVQMGWLYDDDTGNRSTGTATIPKLTGWTKRALCRI